MEAKPTRTGGRSTKCTPTLVKAIAERIGAGMGREAAARSVGISERSLHTWVERGRAGEEPYAQFLQRIEAASETLQGEVSKVLLKGLRSKNPHVSTKTAMWLAERLWPATYGRRSEVTGAGGGPVQIAAAVAVAPLVSPEAARELTLEQSAAMVTAWLAGTAEPQRS
jgi:hypothetical protein